jgi:acyl phosphate:glycerol-3-phosphate acyltransferase
MLSIILLLLAYLLGSVSTALIVGKVGYGIDIREHGSGNAGATNTFRVLGQKAGIIVMIGDIMKGVIAVQLVRLHPGILITTDDFVNFQVVLGIASVVGHVFPIWSQFRGGKGIATLFGMVLSIQPSAAALLVVVFVLMLLITQYVSLSSISASLSFPIIILVIFREPELMYRIFAIAAALVVVITHHKNINRLMQGNESKMNLFKGKKSSDIQKF